MTIVHCFGALSNHEKIEQVLSKGQALEQCSKYLCENYPDVTAVSVQSTSEAARKIAEHEMLDAAAIASEKALKESGLQILAEDICPNNRTRFAILGKKSLQSTGNDKTFLMIHPFVKDKPGVLYNALGVLARYDINLEYVQSRPDGHKGYFFYLEMEGHKDDEKVKKAIDEIKNQEDVKILGSYPNTHWKDED
jgi:chorismate mutase/prephenate dehydratase